MSENSILLGTSSFSATGWEGSFYPRGMRPADYLPFYAQHFNTVEVDSTFYACPTARAVANWDSRTPEGFIFSVKVPQEITHEKVLDECDKPLKEFLDTMAILGKKLGPVVFQFPFFNRSLFPDRNAFLVRLIPFLKTLPREYKFRIALVLQDRSFMSNPSELDFDPITTDWTYIRLLGDRKAIESVTQTWGKTVVDKTAELRSWVDYCHQIRKRAVLIYVYANDHFAGHGPATIEQFRALWRERSLPDPPRPLPKLDRQTFCFPDCLPSSLDYK